MSQIRTLQPRVLLVDLNNFARYPTLAVGLLTAILRRASFRVDVMSPLSLGVPGVPREGRTPVWGLADARLRYATAMSESGIVKRVRSILEGRRHPIGSREMRVLLRSLTSRLELGCDVVLISTYLMYFDACREIARACAEAGVPVVVGGSYFFQPEVAREWTRIPGVKAVVGGEVEPHLPEIVRAVVDGAPLDSFAGVWVDGRSAIPASPLGSLDELPFPDYADFPWHRYPNRIVPMITGRGCGWGVCSFCSDVTSTAGRSFRSRSADNVLGEFESQARSHQSDLFVFTHLKLNSNLEVWDALISKARSRVPCARWIGAVHVAGDRPEGVSRVELMAAKAAGMVRLTTGLESGSQRVLDDMRKGTNVATTHRFLEDAAAAGISVRMTMILGYPGERPVDVELSARFVEENTGRIDRILLNRFALMTGTTIHRNLEQRPDRFADLQSVRANHRMALLDHKFAPAREPEYRRAVHRLLAAVHRVNRRTIRETALEFEGVM